MDRCRASATSVAAPAIAAAVPRAEPHDGMLRPILGSPPIVPRTARPDVGSVTIRHIPMVRLTDRWNWRLSAHLRAVSLASIWAMLLFSSLLGPLITPVVIGRFVLSGTQTVLNVRLGRRRSLGRRPLLDWALLGLTLVAAYGAAAVGASSMYGGHLLALLPMAACYSLIQLRMCRRSYRAHASEIGWAPARVPGPRDELELVKAA